MLIAACKEKMIGNQQIERGWMDLKSLAHYASVSERTLREWIHSGANPLPASRVGAKILVKRSVFDAWLEGHRLTPANAVDVHAIADEILTGMRTA